MLFFTIIINYLMCYYIVIVITISYDFSSNYNLKWDILAF